jgi:hypothetical protein
VGREHGGRALAELLRAGTQGLADEICTGIRRAVPEYARPGEGSLGPVMRPAVEQALAGFVLRVADPSAPLGRMADTCRLLGRIEAEHGRSLNALQSAFRIAFRVAWRRTTRVCAAHRLPSETVAELAEAQLEYMDELASICVEGYSDARARSPEELAELRGKLLRLILERPAVPRRAVAELAERAGWAVPAEATMVVARAGARPVRTALADDVLADLDGPGPRLLIPGAFTAERRAMTEAALPDDRMAVGVTVPLADAADSLRWAVRALALAETGVLERRRVTLCEDHLLTLLLMSDPRLIDELAEQRLAGLGGMSPAKRSALIETLRVWLESWSTAAEVGGRLHVHPQTVRYRLNQLKETMGDRFTDPDARFGLELVLRAMRLRERPAGDTGRRALGGRRRAAGSKAS